MDTAEGLKRQAAGAALERIRSGMRLGLGTGSTVAHFLELLGRALDEDTLTDVLGVPTSIRTDRQAREAGVPLTTLAQTPHLDVTVDGADEVSPELDLIKGMGGALLREKMVAQASDRLVIIADEGKAVDRLGQRSLLPVEVVPFGWTLQASFLETLGAGAELRRFEDGVPFKTDNGNFILDCRFPGGIDEPAALERALRDRVGVVETGLFLHMADEAILAGHDGVRVLRREVTR